ncbi:hypothetical protein RHA1_ro11043 (plasmid) [Rhodococcus jostii RHA1]|uniref:Uncharacterized protein n=1 Tax=Rhodococcus jostii (strain RHA1) TaxID=101510 RepID=Q0RVJ6_RHOJR|nr:hypothetical protein RHA1_ro11043 [Rhodococcus jostii RHA1]
MRIDRGQGRDRVDDLGVTLAVAARRMVQAGCSTWTACGNRSSTRSARHRGTEPFSLDIEYMAVHSPIAVNAGHRRGHRDRQHRPDRVPHTPRLAWIMHCGGHLGHRGVMEVPPSPWPDVDTSGGHGRR